MIILCYHDLSVNEVNRWTLAPDTFRNHLDLLAARGYRTVTLDAIDAGSPFDSRTAVITFDDGRDGCIRHAFELLQQSGNVACFYVCTGFADGTEIPNHEAYSKFMDWSDIRQLAASGHSIGSHAMSHVQFTDLPEGERYRQLAQSKSLIEDQLGQECRHFATPYGYVDGCLIDLSREVGYETLATTVGGVNKSPASRFHLRRWEILSPCDATEFDQTLQRLESQYSFFRVRIIPTDARPELNGKWPLKQLAEYDLILSSEIEACGILDRYGLEFLNTMELGLMHPESPSILTDSERSDLELTLQERCEIPSGCKIQFDFG